jgi:hypothetical protein
LHGSIELVTADLIFIVVLAALVCVGAAWRVSRALRIARQLRGARVVTCQETGRPAVVAIDVRHAIASDPGEQAMRLRACSRWAERGRCDEPCVCEAAVPASTPRAIVERGLRGKTCVFCRRTIEHVAFLGRYPALLQADGTTTPWPDMPLERLQESLGTQRPVCWDCHIAETFRRRYPELVTDRPWTRA